MMKLLKPLETQDVARSRRSRKRNERAHWVQPRLVAQVKFTEWTTDGKLRHPVYLGLRDDKKAADVDARTEARSAFGVRRFGVRRDAATNAPNAERRTANERSTRNAGTRNATACIDQLSALESARKDGVLTLPDGDELKVTNLHKVFWPKQKLTKGDLLRYYARVAPFILPAVADRPLVMKRFPNGVAARAVLPAPRARRAAGVRTRGRRRGRRAAADHRRQPEDAALHDAARGDLAGPVVLARRAPGVRRLRGVRSRSGRRTCRSRACSTSRAGFATSSTRWARPASPKTSGADGLHIYVPLPPGTPYEAGMLFCQIVATLVAQKHPKVATTERSVKARGQAGLHRLPAEHPRQDARDRLQRARQRLRRRLDAGDVAGDRRGVRPHRFHDRHRAGAVREGRRSVGEAAEVEGRGSEEGRQSEI